MLSKIEHYLFPLAVFLTGACVLVIEVVAVRVLSPFYGNTIFTFSSVISVILLALSVGYYYGGKYSDRYPSPFIFFTLILISGLLLLGLYLLGLLLLPLLSSVLPLQIGPLVSATIFFLLPSFLLGALSPYAVKLHSINNPDQGVGEVSGTIFFWGTLGSIIGSLSAGFLLVPLFGINTIFIGTSAVLCVAGLIGMMSHAQKKTNIVALFILTSVLVIASISYSIVAADSYVFSKDGVYEKLTVVDIEYKGRPTRIFQQDRSYSSAMFLDTNDPTDMVFEYTNYYELYKIFTPHITDALVIGGGIYSIPKALLSEVPDVRVDSVEIEPGLEDLATTYFDLQPDDRLHSYTEDGRRFIRESEKEYDLIFNDVYYSLLSIPSHFTTVEFFTLAKSRLKDDGIFVANLLGSLSREEPSFIMSEIKTFQKVFPNMYVFTESPGSTQVQNIMLVGVNNDTMLDLESATVEYASSSFLSTLPDKLVDLERFELSPYVLLTDDYAPSDYLTAKTINDSQTGIAIDGDQMLASIAQQLRYGNRYTGGGGHQAVQRFIQSEMQALTSEVELQVFEHVDALGGTSTLTNIVAQLYPEKTERIIIGTHYDTKKHAHFDNQNVDAAVPGANDGGSGTAVLLELARVLRSIEQPPSVGIDLVFFDGEEGESHLRGDYSDWFPIGSTYFADHIEERYAGNKPTQAIVLDMVCDKDLDLYPEVNSEINAPKLVKTFWQIGEQVDSEVFHTQTGQAIRDDHTPLNAVGIPSFLVIDFEYPAFHTQDDTLDKCSADSLEVVATTVLNYVYNL